jgi:hypothetical protein
MHKINIGGMTWTGYDCDDLDQLEKHLFDLFPPIDVNEVAHLRSFQAAVNAFVTLREREGKEAATDLMDGLTCGWWKFPSKKFTTPLQEAATQALDSFLTDPAGAEKYPAPYLCEVVWRTAKV